MGAADKGGGVCGNAGFASGKRRQTPEPKRFKIKMGVRQAGGDAYLAPAVAFPTVHVPHFFRFPPKGYSVCYQNYLKGAIWANHKVNAAIGLILVAVHY